MSKVSVKETQRSKDLSNLETPEEIQKDIQRMYTEAQKIVNGKKKNVMQPAIESIFYSMKHYVNETKEIGKMRLQDVQFFWHGAYSHLEQIQTLSK